MPSMFHFDSLRRWKIPLITSLAVLFSVTLFSSCRQEAGAQNEPEGEGSAAPKGSEMTPVKDSEPPHEDRQLAGHPDVLARLFELKRDFLEELTAIGDVTAARNFVDSLDRRKAEIRALLKEARALPPADQEIRQRYQGLENELDVEGGSLRQLMAKRFETLPRAGEIQEILKVLSEDREVEALSRGFEEIYRTEP